MEILQKEKSILLKNSLIYVTGCKPLLEEPYYKEIISAVDPDNANKITFDAFIRKLTDMTAFKYGEEEIKEAVAVAVFDDEGKVTLS